MAISWLRPEVTRLRRGVGEGAARFPTSGGAISIARSLSGRHSLFTRPVAALTSSLKQGFLCGGKSARLQAHRHFVEPAAKAKGDLVISVGDRRAGVSADVEGLVPLQCAPWSGRGRACHRT